MKKIATMIATVATLAAVASAPAEARHVRVRVGTGAAIAVSLTHSGNFTQGQQGALYTISISNPGTSSTSGTLTCPSLGGSK